jgi:hypothetical protein
MEIKLLNILEIVKNLVLAKLNGFCEQANRDRFILPKNFNVSFIVNVINDVLNYIDKPTQIISYEIQV